MNELLTVKDVAHVLQCSEDAVIRRFAKLDGVIDLGRSTLGVRRYRVLRIPKSVVEKYLTSKLPKTDRTRSVQIEVPPASCPQAEISQVGRPRDTESRQGGSAE